MSLCHFCQEFDIQAFKADPEGLRGYSLRAIRQSARDGCCFCELLQTTLNDTSSDGLLPFNEDEEADDLWLHMRICGNDVTTTARTDLHAPVNRLQILVGPRFLLQLGPRPGISLTQQNPEWQQMHWLVREREENAKLSWIIGSRRRGIRNVPVLSEQFFGIAADHGA
jgi:hypothetical protein